MKPTQIQMVKNKQKETGQISRNDCLSHFISRLGAIIAVLKMPPYNYEFTAYYQKNEKGQDYIYRWTNKKPELKVNIKVVNGQRVVSVTEGF